MIAIGKQLEKLWATHRNEIAANQVWEVLPTDRIHLATFDDFHSRRALVDKPTTWLVNDEGVWIKAETWMQANHPICLKKPTIKRFVAPKQRPDLRKRSCVA
jgi:hypothetical protein